MGRIRVAVSADEVRERVQYRMAGGAKGKMPVAWQAAGSEVLVWARKTAVQFADGWLLVKVPMSARETGRRTHVVSVAFFVGREQGGMGMRATTTLDTADPTGLLSLWGEHIQAATWDGLLDGVEIAAKTARRRLGNQATKGGGLVGFAANAEGLTVEFFTGEER